MALLVLLGHAEVDVEEEEPAGGRRLGAAAGEELAEPVDVDEPVVAGEPIDRPIGSAAQAAKPPPRIRDAVDAELARGMPRRDRRLVVGSRP